MHRKRTERREGLGENVVLSGYDANVLREFLDDPDGAASTRANLPTAHPSESDRERPGRARFRRGGRLRVSRSEHPRLLQRNRGMSGLRASVIVFVGVGIANLSNYLFHLLSARSLGPSSYGDVATLAA